MGNQGFVGVSCYAWRLVYISSANTAPPPNTANTATPVACWISLLLKLSNNYLVHRWDFALNFTVKLHSFPICKMDFLRTPFSFCTSGIWQPSRIGLLTSTQADAAAVANLLDCDLSNSPISVGSRFHPTASTARKSSIHKKETILKLGWILIGIRVEFNLDWREKKA